jgi:hypothetical protein
MLFWCPSTVKAGEKEQGSMICNFIQFEDNVLVTILQASIMIEPSLRFGTEVRKTNIVKDFTK